LRDLLGILPSRFVLTLSEYGEGEGEQADQEQDQDPECQPLPHLVSSLGYEPPRHSNPIRKARLVECARVLPRVMYNVAMCSTLSPEVREEERYLGAELQGGYARGR
jgi:hypothetical protein